VVSHISRKTSEIWGTPRTVGYSGWKTPHDLLNIQGEKQPKVGWTVRVGNDSRAVGYSG
jgi:hypothetical protein